MELLLLLFGCAMGHGMQDLSFLNREQTHPLQWEHRALTIGQSGNSQMELFKSKLSDHNGIKLDINIRNKFREFASMWKSSNS